MPRTVSDITWGRFTDDLPERPTLHFEVGGVKPSRGNTTTKAAHQFVSGSILPEEVEWRPFAAFPPAARLAVISGNPMEPGPYTIRVKMPRGERMMPHRHPEDRIYTVISGVFYIGLGDSFDEEKLVGYPPGAVIFLPGNTSHFHLAKSGEYVTQVSAVGPLGLEYLDASDDPRTRTPPNIR